MAPIPPLDPKRRRILRGVALFAALPSVGAVLLVGFFIARTELAFDEARCPFRRVREQMVDARATVRDEGRRCGSDLIEHRWLVLARGRPPLEIGRRRLAASFFGSHDYSWSANRASDGRMQVHVTFHDPRVRPSIYRELP